MLPTEMLVTNIEDVDSDITLAPWERTHLKLLHAGLELFERKGFEATTVAEIAAAAGVTEMTYYRHFATKSGVLFEDPYDAVIADAVGAQSTRLPPTHRAVAGLRQAWAQVPEPEDELIRRRVRVVANTASLRGEMVRVNAETERLIAEQLIDDGADPLPAKVAAAALLAAVTAALFEWSDRDDIGLGQAIELALQTVEGFSHV